MCLQHPKHHKGAELEKEDFVFQNRVLALTYFLKQLPVQYRPRCSVSLSCSEWKGMVPLRTKDQSSALKGAISLFF